MADLAVWPTDGAGPGGDGSVSSEARWRKMARLWVPSGVRGAGDLVPTLVAGPTINVTVGQCWLDGHYAELLTPASVAATANGLLCVRFTGADNHAELLYRDAATLLTQTDPTWELPIAQMVAGALRDIRWIANPTGELAFAAAAATVTLTSAHTPAAPIDLTNSPAVYCDGGTYEFLFTSSIVTLTGGGSIRAQLWVDGAAVSAPQAFIAQAGVSLVPMMGRQRYAPAAGVHQIRARGFLTTPATGGTFDTQTQLSLRRI